MNGLRRFRTGKKCDTAQVDDTALAALLRHVFSHDGSVGLGSVVGLVIQNGNDDTHLDILVSELTVGALVHVPGVGEIDCRNGDVNLFSCCGSIDQRNGAGVRGCIGSHFGDRLSFRIHRGLIEACIYAGIRHREVC